MIIIYVFADENDSSIEKNYIDDYHKTLSSKVKEWGVDIDSAILSFYNLFEDEDSLKNKEEQSFPIDVSTKIKTNQSFAENNITKKDTYVSKTTINNYLDADCYMSENEKVDSLFLTRKFLEERDTSFVRISFVKIVNSLENDPSTVTVRARLGLGESKKRLKLFIEDFNEDSAKNIGTSGEQDSPSIGLELSLKERLGIKSKYSVGFHGIDPFVRARYSRKSEFGIWSFTPVQTFTYSIEDEFSEETEFYLDTPTGDSALFRFVVDRGTQSHVDGMRYDGFIQWFWIQKKNEGLSINFGFNGSTKYERISYDTVPPSIDHENKVFNYLFLIRWRKSVYKPWIFYEVGTGVNYHEVHDYRPNYNIYFGLDLFFGHV